MQCIKQFESHRPKKIIKCITVHQSAPVDKTVAAEAQEVEWLFIDWKVGGSILVPCSLDAGDTKSQFLLRDGLNAETELQFKFIFERFNQEFLGRCQPSFIKICGVVYDLIDWNCEKKILKQ